MSKILHESGYFGYIIPPIDHNAESLQTPQDTMNNLNISADVEQVTRDKIDIKIKTMQKLAKKWSKNIDADTIVFEKIFWIPVGDEFQPGYAVKYLNNGTTVIVSPIELPHYDEYSSM